MDETGPEIIVSRLGRAVIPNYKLSGGMSGATFNINVSGTGNAEVIAAAQEGMNRALKQYDATLPNRVDAIQRDWLKRYS
ncbi:hypothetical protein SAMN04487971_1102 [Paracoccus chinensis]|uniref:Uncharacterized protein n=2 Tax=Paracoccus chinensis TaxID=525640 RepID=A0A1G9JPY6_9RHOB|nr:hypothetical protein SAMN04487971_1102 [Paracoccus chinensis]